MGGAGDLEMKANSARWGWTELGKNQAYHFCITLTFYCLYINVMYVSEEVCILYCRLVEVSTGTL